MAARRKGGNLVVGGAVSLFALAMGTYPYFAVRSHEASKMQTRDEALTGSQIQRGQYINSGSRDAGRDPDWDLKTNTWRGKRVQVKP